MSELSLPEPATLDQRHLIVIATRSPTDCLAAIAHALPRVGGRLRGFSLKPVGAQFEATLRLSSLGDAGADRRVGPATPIFMRPGSGPAWAGCSAPSMPKT